MVDRLIPLLEVSDDDEVGPETRNDPRKVGQCPEHWNWETSIGGISSSTTPIHSNGSFGVAERSRRRSVAPSDTPTSSRRRRRLSLSESASAIHDNVNTPANISRICGNVTPSP